MYAIYAYSTVTKAVPTPSLRSSKHDLYFKGKTSEVLRKITRPLRAVSSINMWLTSSFKEEKNRNIVIFLYFSH